MVETVTVERFKSLNNKMYDTLEEAERADAAWREENEYESFETYSPTALDTKNPKPGYWDKVDDED